jgi:hypothetical protein
MVEVAVEVEVEVEVEVDIDDVRDPSKSSANRRALTSSARE